MDIRIDERSLTKNEIRLAQRLAARIPEGALTALDVWAARGDPWPTAWLCKDDRCLPCRLRPSRTELAEVLARLA
jgi:hypothetical protein